MFVLLANRSGQSTRHLVLCRSFPHRFSQSFFSVSFCVVIILLYIHFFFFSCDFSLPQFTCSLKEYAIFDHLATVTMVVCTFIWFSLRSRISEAIHTFFLMWRLKYSTWISRGKSSFVCFACDFSFSHWNRAFTKREAFGFISSRCGRFWDTHGHTYEQTHNNWATKSWAIGSKYCWPFLQ